MTSCTSHFHRGEAIERQWFWWILVGDLSANHFQHHRVGVDPVVEVTWLLLVRARNLAAPPKQQPWVDSSKFPVIFSRVQLREGKNQ